MSSEKEFKDQIKNTKWSLSVRFFFVFKHTRMFFVINCKSYASSN